MEKVDGVHRSVRHGQPRKREKVIVTVKTCCLTPKNETDPQYMETNIIYVSTHTDKEEVASLFGKYEFSCRAGRR